MPEASRRPSATYVGPITDTHRWPDSKHRPDDIFICTPPKCGTTWTQAIYAMLVSGKVDHGTQPGTKRDFRGGAIASMATHLDIDLDAPLLSDMTQAAIFDNMKNNAEQFAPQSGTGIWKAEAGFFSSGTNQQWKQTLTDINLEAFNARLDELLPAAEAQWLLHGNH